jgi:hypothetical protein
VALGVLLYSKIGMAVGAMMCMLWVVFYAPYLRTVEEIMGIRFMLFYFVMGISMISTICLKNKNK